jgi:excisionase family DNA binding protein
MSEFLTMEEAAERLGVDYKTVYRLVRTGELPAGKIGRIYRIRTVDLDGYFERQKQLVADQGRKLVPVAGIQCGACGREIVSELSVGGRCTECDREICQACWAIRKRRVCESHESAGSTAATTAETAKPGGDARAEQQAEREAEIARLRKAGRPVVTTDDARLAEETFLRAFGQRFEQIEELPEPLSGRAVRLRDARVKHKIVEGAKARRGEAANRISRFTLRTGGWGKPKVCLTLEGRFIARTDALKKDGYEAAPIGRSELAQLLNELAAEVAKDEECFRVVLMASPTGWSEEASALVTNPQGSGAFRDKRAAVVLCDLHADKVLLDESDGRLQAFWPLVAPERQRRAVQECMETVRDLVLRRGSVSLADAVKASAGAECFVRAAFAELAEAGSYIVDELDGVGPVISRLDK